MVPFVPTMTASLRSFNAEDHVSTAILLLLNFRVTTTVSSAPVEGKKQYFSSVHCSTKQFCTDEWIVIFFSTCLITGPHSLDALWLLSRKHHACELQAVDAKIQGCSSTQGLIYWPQSVRWNTKLCLQQFHLAHFPLSKESSYLHWCGEESGPDSL